MTTAYRFLVPDRQDPLAGIEWSTSWTVHGPGLIAYPVHCLHHWLTPELWRVELDGATHDRELSVTATRARLVERVAEWDDDACADFVRWCVERHPTMAAIPFAGWTAACCAGYVASQLAGAEAEARGVEYPAGADAERAVQLEWVGVRAGLDVETV